VAEELVLYMSRHTRLTELAASLLQDVAGHTTFQMTWRYLHTANQTPIEKGASISRSGQGRHHCLASP
jgi:integrase